MTGFNTQLSAECISLLNLVVALSSLVQLNNICAIKSNDCAASEVSPLSKPEAQRQGTKTPSVDRMEKKPWEKPGSVGGASSPPARTNQ